jgi:hypothetical protein
MLFYKAESATEFIMARGRTEMDIKRAAMANMKVFSHAGIRIIPERNSPQSKLIHSNTIRTYRRRRREAAFHTHRRYQKNSRQEVNRLQHLPNSRKNALLDLLTQRKVMQPWAWHWLFFQGIVRNISISITFVTRNESHRKCTQAKKFLMPISDLVCSVTVPLTCP